MYEAKVSDKGRQSKVWRHTYMKRIMIVDDKLHMIG